MSLLGHHIVWWHRLATSRASTLDMLLGVACRICGHCCCSAPNKSHPSLDILATVEGYLLPGIPCALSNPSLVTCCLTFPSSSPLKPCLNEFLTLSSIHCHSIYLSFSNISKGSQFSKVTDTAACTITQDGDTSQSCFEQPGLSLVLRCSFSNYPAA